jgi:hypothetical protein
LWRRLDIVLLLNLCLPCPVLGWRHGAADEWAWWRGPFGRVVLCVVLDLCVPVCGPGARFTDSVSGWGVRGSFVLGQRGGYLILSRLQLRLRGSPLAVGWFLGVWRLGWGRFPGGRWGEMSGKWVDGYRSLSKVSRPRLRLRLRPRRSGWGCFGGEWGLCECYVRPGLE